MARTTTKRAATTKTTTGSAAKTTTTPKAAAVAAAPKTPTRSPTAVSIPKTTPAAAATPAATAATPAVASATPGPAKVITRRNDMIERIVARSGMKKKDVKPAFEAMLAVFGEALANGEEMNLPPLGKVMVNREKDNPTAKIMMVKVRQNKVAGTGPTAAAAVVAPAAE